MIFYTADLHLGYFPILHDTARPFTGVLEMDEALISNWNARVGADDSVYIVGDFSYNGGEAPTQYLSRLNGHLHLIRGNHDTGLNHAERLLDYCDSVTDFLEIDDGGTLQTPMDKRLSFLLWKDYTSMAGGNSKFGVYDSEYNIFMELPESMHGNILIRSNQSGTGWLICNADGTTVYCEMRVVDPADNAATGVGNYLRIANIGSQQLQARVVTSYYGLSLDFISQNTVLLGSN